MKIFATIVAILALTGFGITIWNAYEDFTCQMGFKGLQTNWSFFGGCQIETKPGIWIPRENYRSE